MNFRKIAAVGAAFVMAASIVTGFPLSTRDVKFSALRKCRTYQHLRYFVKS